MVYFNCGLCGEGLRKNQIETHGFKCKSRSFSCSDCQKDFKNDEYKAHTKCMTESERYESKTSFEAKASKGELKQNMWLDKVNRAVDSFRGSPKAKLILSKLVDFPNIPRKKVKFVNFMKNSFRSFGLNDSLLDEIWSVIDSFDKAAPNTTNGNVNKRPVEEVTESVETVKKLKPDTESQEEFNWFELIKKQCEKDETNRQISYDKLVKKLFKKYKEHHQETAEDKDAFEHKLNKKLKKYKTSFNLVEQESSESGTKFVQLVV